LTKLKVCNRADYTLKYSRRCPAQLAVESQPDEHTLRYRIETRSVVSSIRDQQRLSGASILPDNRAYAAHTFLVLQPNFVRTAYVSIKLY